MRLDLPLTVPIGKKSFSLNFNIYRNTHYAVLAKAKSNYKLLIKTPKNISFNRVRLEYTLFTKTKRRLDISNVCCVVDKFICDILVERGILKDDSYDIVIEVVYRYGGVDKDRPRCELLIVEV